VARVTFIIIFITTILYADANDVESNFVLESESFELNHQSIYGVTNNYSFVVAQHNIKADDNTFLFYYGTKVGVVTEDFTAANGFGPALEEFALVFNANMGFDFDIDKFQVITLEGSHIEDGLRSEIENIVTIGYELKF